MKIIPWLCIIGCLVACGENKEKITEQKTTDTKQENVSGKREPTDTASKYRFTGFYVGDFKAVSYSANANQASVTNKINIVIDTLWGKNVKGHSVVAGNLRPFDGYSIAETDSTITYKVAEPGDDKYDGRFEFTWYKNKNILKGKWYANDTGLAVNERVYELYSREFSYNPDFEISADKTLLSSDQMLLNFEGEVASEEAAKFNASVVELKKADIENMSGTDLELMRNTIYARHGYSFKNRKMRYYFDRYEDWYIPVSIDIRKELTPLEKKNIELIKRYEEHAARYYDSYGR